MGRAETAATSGKGFKTVAIKKKTPTTCVAEAVCSGGGGDTRCELF